MPNDDETMTTCHSCDKNMPENGKGWFTLRCEGCDTEWTFCPEHCTEAVTMTWAGSECIYCPEDEEENA